MTEPDNDPREPTRDEDPLDAAIFRSRFEPKVARLKLAG